MKKNAMLKVAAGLMVAVLLTTCAISSTFAKYVKAGTPGTPLAADIAEWNLTLATTGTGVFLDSYENGQSEEIAAKVSSTNNIIAPGLSNSGTFTSTVSGTSEVAFKVTATAVVTLGGFTDDYCPIVFEVDDVQYACDKTNGTETGKDIAGVITYNSVENFQNGVAAAIAKAAASGADAEFAPGEYAEEAIASGVEVAWSWPFYVSEANDQLDTGLQGTDNAISIDVYFGAEQINDLT